MELEVYWLQLAEDKLDDIYSYYKATKRYSQFKRTHLNKK